MDRLSLEQILSNLLNKIQNIRLKNKIKEDYDEVYILLKCFFKLLDIDFPSEEFKVKFDSKYKVYFDRVIEEFIILGYYMDYKELALKLSDNLILDLNCKINKSQIVSNQRYYIPKLKTIKNEKINIKLDQDTFALNPSILKIDNGYLINCRVINYQINDQGSYMIHHPNKTIITKNIILHTDKEFNILNQYYMIDSSECKKFEGRNIIGLEDLIIFRWNDELWFTCTNLETNQYGIPQINLCKLNLNNDKYEIVKRYPIDLINNRAEKNWLPYIQDNQLKIIYEYYPYTIKTIFNYSDITDISKNTYGLNISRFKGSAAPIELDGGYLIIVHETFNLAQVLRCYLHRFIWLSNSFEIKKMSHPWHFQHYGIEFCRSMCYSHTEGEIILTYSIHDKDAQWCSVSIDYIRSLLFNLDYFKF